MDIVAPLSCSHYHLLIVLLGAHVILSHHLPRSQWAGRFALSLPVGMGVIVAICFLDGAGLIAGLFTLTGYAVVPAIISDRREANCWYYLTEQAVEIILLVTLVAWLGEAETGAWLDGLAGLPLQALAIGTGLGFVWWQGATAVGLLVQDISRGATSEQTGNGTPAAGKLIGRLERTLIVFLVLANVPSGVGFLIAAKSILRFGEVTQPGNREVAEYVLIGTLASFALAIPVAYATAMLVRWAR